MNIDGFRRKYPALAAAFGAEFADSAAQDDEQTAREFAMEFPPEKRVVYLEAVLGEAKLLIPEIDAWWVEIARQTNRRFDTLEATRGWVHMIVDQWRKALEEARLP